MYFEELVVETEFATGLRQINEVEVTTFLDLSLLKNPIFMDDRAARAVGHPKRILPAPLLICLAMGLCQQRGLVKLRFELHNQRRESVLEMQAVYLMVRRPQLESAFSTVGLTAYCVAPCFRSFGLPLPRSRRTSGPSQNVNHEGFVV